MTPQENIKWYWKDLSSRAKVGLLMELYGTLSKFARYDFLSMLKEKELK